MLNVSLFLRVIYRSLFKAKRSPVKLTPKRVFVILVAYLLYIVVEGMIWASFLLDELFFPRYREQPVTAPVFIIGNPRSGTTFLQRLLAKDRETFATMRMWEIFFAPSIVQRRLISITRIVDRLMGDRMMQWLRDLEERYRDPTWYFMHKARLGAPEEDEYLLLHIASTIVGGLFSGVLDLAMPYAFFDERVPPEERGRVMQFYRTCVRRHLFARRAGETVHYLAKDPYFSPKVAALLDTFPDAKFIYLVRSPLEVIPSYTSLSAHLWHLLFKLREPYPYRESILAITQHWYRYPVAVLEGLPEDRVAFVKFGDLTAEPSRTVRELYDRFGFRVNEPFERELHKADERSRAYRSKHTYSLEEMGYTREQILDLYADVFERWGFDR